MTARRMRLEQKAVEAGFTEQGLYCMLLVLNLDEATIKDMTRDGFQDLLSYVNSTNAQTFNRF